MENENQLLTKINEAVAAANEANEASNVAAAAANEAWKRVKKTQDVAASRNMTVGKLLLEAKKQVKDFDAFLKRVVGLKKARVRELMAIAGGDITEEESKRNTRQRVQKHRANKQRPKPELVSVTSAPVTEADRSTRALAEFTDACHQYLPNMTQADKHKASQLVAKMANEPKAEAA
jgi:hypothetical protein